MRRKVRWPVKKLFNRNLKKKVNIWLQTLEMQKTFKDIEQGSLEEEGYFCEAEQGILFDEESEDEKERQEDDLGSCLRSSGQLEDLVVKTPNGSMESYVFNTNYVV